MDNQPLPPRDLWVPILLGGFSVFGLAAVLLFARARNQPMPVDVTPSPTSPPYIFLGTEPAVTTLTPDASEVVPLETPEEELPGFPTSSVPTLSTPASLPTNTPGLILRTSTPVRLVTATSIAGTFTYDDTDPRLIYSSGWTSDPNFVEAYQGTLHISNRVGNTVSFAFTGQRIHVFYQAGDSLGTISITIDGGTPEQVILDQEETEIQEWVSDTLPSGPHTLLIQHASGGSINIDSLMVPAATTATPAPTTSATVTGTTTP